MMTCTLEKLLPDLTQQCHRSSVQAANVRGPSRASTPSMRSKLYRQTISLGYFNVPLVNAPLNFAARFVFKQPVGFEIANRASKLENDPRLDVAIGQGNRHVVKTLV
jgi:hypothetical protein